MTKEYTLKTLNLYDIAKLGLWLDDPYGDGIRLECIRNPNSGRRAAMKLMGYIEYGLEDENIEQDIRKEYESAVKMLFLKDGRICASARRNAPKR